MRVAVVCSLILAAASSAGATPDASTTVAPPPQDVTIDTGVGGWSTIAELTSESTATPAGTTTAGEVVVGAELHRDATMCRLLGVGVVGQLRDDRDGTHLGGDQTLAACFGFAHLVAIEFDNHYELANRPSLSARRELWRRPYDRDTFNYQSRWFDFDASDRLHVTAIHTDLGVAWSSQTADARSRSLALLDARVELGRFGGIARPGEAPPWQVDLLDFHGETVDDDRFTAETFQMAFLHATNLPFHGVFLDGSLGLLVGSLVRDDPETPTMLVQATRPGGELGVHAHAGRVSGGVGVARSEYATFDLELSREDRLSAWLTLHRGRSDLTLRSFTARTEVVPATGASQRGITGGGQAELERDAGHVHIALSAEVARSYYAQVDSTVMATPTPELGARLLASFSARAHSR